MAIQQDFHLLLAPNENSASGGTMKRRQFLQLAAGAAVLPPFRPSQPRRSIHRGPFA
jgi:hypothetical protein